MTSYDYDRHSSRRHDSIREQPGGLLTPDTSYDSKRHHGQRRSVSRRREDDRRHYEERPRSAHSSDDQQSRHSRPRRQAWPPQPRAESEVSSLAREDGGMAQLQKEYKKREVPSRGTIDQDPIIQDVPEHMNQSERRFVMLSKTDTAKSMHTPPSSGDERRRAQRRPSRLNTDLDNLPPEPQRHRPSSYGISAASSRPTRGPSAAFLSPDVLTPPAYDTQRRKTAAVDPQVQARSPRTSPSARKGRDYFSHENAIDDTDDTSRPSSRGSYTRAGAAAQEYTHNAKQADHDTRRHTETGLPRPRGVEKAIRPLTAAVAAGVLSEAVRSAREGGSATPRSATLNPASLLREVGGGSRTASPATSIHSHRSTSPPPPARLARYSTDYSQDRMSSPDSRRASAISSRAGSRPTTPPFGNIAMPKMPQTDDDWSGIIAANMRKSGLQSKRPSGFSSTMRADPVPSVPRVSRGGALPYPVNEGPATPDVFMPQETEHQWIPSVAPARMMPAASTQPRPSFPSSKDVVPPKVDPAPEVRLTKAESEAMLKRGLPGCSRPVPVAGKDDWYTLIGAPSLDFCPDCIDVFERTIYRKCFRRSPPRDLATRIGCAFGTPWIRLAYLLSVQERLPNLKLIKELADIDNECDPCPGHQVAIRTWHGLRDDEGLFVRDFNICQADIYKLQHLLPTFKNFFQRLPDNAMYEKRRCALRPETSRFTTYLDALISLHDNARLSKALPDRNQFISLVEKKLSYRECERDAFVVGGLWHFMPALPHFTVCEDCFHDVIEPHTHKSEIARRFNRAVQPAYHEGHETGTSCQLYSPRMRKVFRIAVEDNDYKYLARKSRERKDAELRLQQKHGVLLTRASRIATGTGSAEEQGKKRRLEKDLEEIMAEWREDWE